VAAARDRLRGPVDAIDKVQTSIEVCVNYRTGIEEHTAGDDGKVELVPPRLACLKVQLFAAAAF
jgi:hypothetical protein